MIRLIKILLLFAGAFLIYDKLFILITYRSAEVEVDKRLEYIVRGEIDSDIIFLGSSRGARGILAEQVENEMSLPAYNLCYPGSSIEFHEFLIRTLVEFNNAPKIVFLVVDDDTEFKYNNAINFRKDRLYPLVRYPYIWNELAERDNRDKLFGKFLILSRLNKYNFDFRSKSFTSLDTIVGGGSMPISWQTSYEDRYLKEFDLIYSKKDEVNKYVKAYEKIVETCDVHNIQLVILFPPLMREHSVSFEHRIKELGNENTRYMIYNVNNPIYRDRDYFHDGGHLLRHGAEIFTDEIVEYLDDFTQ